MSGKAAVNRSAGDNIRTAADVRRDFLEFFRAKLHTLVPSSPVVPYDDPTLLFTNAGMNQFKPIFLGQRAPDVDKWHGATPGSPRRAANSQPCIRAGGKHNDLDDVGHDTYHHTFFEMLGNWSFGDYFKKEAIEWAWELITQVWGLDAERLHATYFGGDQAENLPPDEEARDLWRRFLPAERIHPGNKKDNFWEMGDTGPCGPCSEMHIDLTPDKSGGPLVNAGDERVIEFWNLVFIQFNRGPDGKLAPLPARHVDTGMGFERITRLIQGKRSNYDIDVFTPIFAAIQRVSGAAAYAGLMEGDQADASRGRGAEGQSDPGSIGVPPVRAGSAGVSAASHADVMRDTAYRVIADHIRTLTFALADGAVPDKEGRGYVLRRILRRAIRYGWQYLNLHKPFMAELVETVVAVMGDAFPKLKEDPKRIAEIIREEEESFARTLERGLKLFDEAAGRARDHHNEIHGEDAFKLHDTFGFPIDLTQIMADEKGLRVDIGEYERLMEEARNRARGTKRNLDDAFDRETYEKLAQGAPTDDSLKYVEPFECDALLIEFGGPGAAFSAGATISFMTNRTPFYAEQGGQVADVGVIEGDRGFRIEVKDVSRHGEYVFHSGTITEGTVSGGQVRMRVDRSRRTRIMQNHTATHVLNWALREVLGEHVQQKGSLVDPDKTRFDFAHTKAMTPEEIERVERLCLEQIRQGLDVHTNDNVPVPQKDAVKINGLRAVFGEKYPDLVRVVSIGRPVADLLASPDNAEWRKYSIEFCGGTHVTNTREIEDFVLVAEESVAKGVRRLVGVSGAAARAARRTGDDLLHKVRQLVETPPAEAARQVALFQETLTGVQIPLLRRNGILELLAQLQAIARKQHEQTAAASADTLNARIDALLPAADRVAGATVFVAEVPDVGIDQLKGGADRIKQKCASAAIVLGTRDATGEKVTLLAAMSPDLIKKGLKAGDLVKAIAPIVGGGGGGPPTMAQAGGKDPSKLPDALAAGKAWIAERLGQA